MRFPIAAALAAFVSGATLPTVVDAQDPPPGDAAAAFLELAAEIDPLADILRHPDFLNNLVGSLDGANPISRLLRDINFKFKTFEVPGADDASAALGFEYDFSKSIENWSAAQGTHPLSMSLNVHGRGNVAFSRALNPHDFLETGAKLQLYQFISAANSIPLDSVRADALQQAALEAAKVTGSPEEVDASPAWRQFEQRFREGYLSKLGTDLLWDFAGVFNLESNQDFTTTQLAYGAELGLVPRAWNADAALSKFNLFDYPFALLRLLTGVEDEFTPSGRAFPSILLGLALVDPTGNDERTALTGDEDTYTRFHGALAMRSRVGRVAGENVWFSASWRFFKELGAADVIEEAGLDDPSYFAFRLDLPRGLFVTFATGRLPLDLKDQEVWELGFKFTS